MPGTGHMQVRDTRATAAAIAAIYAQALDPESTFEIRQAALLIVGDAKTDVERSRRLWAWCRDHVEFLLDPPGREFVQAPLWLLEYGSYGRIGTRAWHPWARGDCDCFATLLVALGSAIGLRVRVRICEDPRDQTPWWALLWRRWRHVWCEHQVAGRWMPVDASLAAKGLPWGFAVPDIYPCRTSTIYPGDFRLPPRGTPSDDLGWVSEAINAGSGLIKSAIDQRTQNRLIRAMRDVEVARAYAQARVDAAMAAVAGQRAEIAEEREARLERERKAAEALRRAETTEYVIWGVGALGTLALLAVLLRRRTS